MHVVENVVVRGFVAEFGLQILGGVVISHAMPRRDLAYRGGNNAVERAVRAQVLQMGMMKENEPLRPAHPRRHARREVVERRLEVIDRLGISGSRLRSGKP